MMKRFSRLCSFMLANLLTVTSLLSCTLTPPSEPPSGEQNTDSWTRADEQETVTDYLTLHGRTYMNGKTLELFWTYSGFSLRFEGTGIKARLTTSTTNNSFYGYLNIYIDGALAPDNTVCVTQNGTYTLADGLDEGVHTIEVRKRNEAVYGESATIGVRELNIIEGCFITEAPVESELQIEFIGDSITGGFGNMVTDGSGAMFTTHTEDGTMTYAALTGQALGADVHIISRSGICYVTGTNKDSISDDYAKTAALPNHQSCADAWDFSAEPSDVVVINLGTNDSGASIDGKQITPDQIKEQAVEFIRMVRSHNPDALIVWAYGMIDAGRTEALRCAVELVNNDGDSKVYFVSLPTQNKAQNGVGVHNHPSIQSHILSAQVLTQALSELLDRDMDGKVLLEAQIRCIEDYRLGEKETYAPASYAKYKEILVAAKALLTSDTAANKDCAAMAQALIDGLDTLASVDEVSSEYIVIDTCDQKGAWVLNGDSAGIDSESHLWGEGCFTTTGTGDLHVNFLRTSDPYGITLPENWIDWYLELWVYIDGPEGVTRGSDIEVSQAVDQIEIAYAINSLALKAGWNHLCLPVSAAGKNKIEQFETLNYIRIFFRNLTRTITFRVDDIVLPRGRYAGNTQELETLLAEARQKLDEDGDNAALAEAIALAEAATSQRSVDLAAEKLKKWMD